MAKISQSLGFTVRIGDSTSNQYAKVSLEISDVDTSISLLPQLNIKSDKEVLVTVDNLFKYVKKKLDEQLEVLFTEIKNEPTASS